MPLWDKLYYWELEEFSKVIMGMQIRDSVKDLHLGPVSPFFLWEGWGGNGKQAYILL